MLLTKINLLASTKQEMINQWTLFSYHLNSVIRTKIDQQYIWISLVDAKMSCLHLNVSMNRAQERSNARKFPFSMHRDSSGKRLHSTQPERERERRLSLLGRDIINKCGNKSSWCSLHTHTHNTAHLCSRMVLDVCVRYDVMSFYCSHMCAICVCVANAHISSHRRPSDVIVWRPKLLSSGTHVQKM